MKRKEAKKYDWFRHDREDIEKHIDKIYDDFESRTCENCINYSDTENEGFWCEEFEESFININERPENFGCNKWERIDE